MAELDTLMPVGYEGKTAWMDTTVRACLVAVRPWSLPASIVPITVTAALIHQSHPELSLFSPTFILAGFVVVLLHAAANLFNTFYDFTKGIDTKADADDRALVDATISTTAVWRMAVGCACGGLGSAGLLAQYAGTTVYWLALPAGLLSWLYSADPFSLKGAGLGELVIFAMFGPMLMAGVSLALTNEVEIRTLGYSVPLGLLTTAVLHANNARDVKADQRAGLTTVAIYLQQAGNVKLLELLYAAAYTAVVTLMVVFETSYRQGMVGLCIPWALYTTRRARAMQYFELPQYVAQHNLMFGVILTAALSRPLFTARVCIACLYLLGGINNVIMWQHARALVHMKLTNAFPALSVHATLVLFAGAVVFQIVTSLLFMLGFETVMMARLLLLWVIPVTFITHDFWTIETEHPAHDWSAAIKSKRPVSSRKVPIFLTEFDNEFVHFFKNVGMIGALVMYCELEG